PRPPTTAPPSRTSRCASRSPRRRCAPRRASARAGAPRARRRRPRLQIPDRRLPCQPCGAASRGGSDSVTKRQPNTESLQTSGILDVMTGCQPLLCELHAHTTWSDGMLSPRALCDLYGQSGFDVLAVTDHTVIGEGHVREENFAAYLEEIEAEAERARR